MKNIITQYYINSKTCFTHPYNIKNILQKIYIFKISDDNHFFISIKQSSKQKLMKERKRKVYWNAAMEFN